MNGCRLRASTKNFSAQLSNAVIDRYLLIVFSQPLVARIPFVVERFLFDFGPSSVSGKLLCGVAGEF